MWWINRAATVCFDAVFSLMETWPGWLSLLILSGVTGIGALIAYKYTSNQDAIGRVHDDIKVNLLAAKLFKDNLSVTLKSQGRLFWAATRLFGLSMVPLAVMIVPMALLLCQMAQRYEWRPLQPEEMTLLTLELHPGTPEKLEALRLEVNDGVEVEAGPNRMFSKAYKEFPERNAVAWRLRPTESGRHILTVHCNGETVRKELMVSDSLYARVSPLRPDKSFIRQLEYPVEKPAATEATVQSIRAEFPAGSTPVFGWDVHWIITWLVEAMIIALIFKPFLNVKMW